MLWSHPLVNLSCRSHEEDFREKEKDVDPVTATKAP